MSPKRKKECNTKTAKTAIVIVSVLLAMAVLWLLLTDVGTAADLPEDVLQQTASTEQDEENVILNRKLKVEKIGSYNGIYMEDGTEDLVTDILMMVVTNVSEDDIQYAEIELPVGDETAKFTMSTIPAGSTVVLLEKNRMPYSSLETYRKSAAECTLLAVHQQELSLQEDRLKIQLLDGAINLTNISQENIDGTIVIYYKNYADGNYYGGITYRIKLEDGLRANELKQIMADHFYQPGSQILFVEILA